MDVQLLHHISLPVADVERSRRFYLEVMRLPSSPARTSPSQASGSGWATASCT